MEYHKIPTAWARDPATNYKTLQGGIWATPELAVLRNLDWIFQEKVDGTNIRVIWDGELVEFRGRTDRAQLPPHLLKALQEHFTPVRLGDGLTGPVTLFGEGYGAKIQKGGGDYRPDAGFILFDVWAGVWLTMETVQEIAGSLAIPHVPICGHGSLLDAIQMAKEGFESKLRSTPPEGLVMRPPLELADRHGNRIITKIKLKDFRR